MQTNQLALKWTPIAGFLLIGGALAWTLKLSVIVATNGRIIDSGAAAIFMKLGLLLLVVGSTGLGNHLSWQRPVWLRIAAILLSPVITIASFILFAFITSPLLEGSSIWYAQQEAPIAVAVIVYMTIGFLLYKSRKSVTAYNAYKETVS